MAPARGLEPRSAVLETAVLALDDTDVNTGVGFEPTSCCFAGSSIAALAPSEKMKQPWITGQATILQPAGSEPAALPVELPVSKNLAMSRACHPEHSVQTGAPGRIQTSVLPVRSRAICSLIYGGA